ncbi:hypothetical protein ACKWTF_006417 [Chironomus riparius]
MEKFQKFVKDTKVKFSKLKNSFVIESRIRFDEFFATSFWLLNAIGYDFRKFKDATTKSEKINIALHNAHYWFGNIIIVLLVIFSELELWCGPTTNLSKRLFGTALLMTYFINQYRILSFWYNKSKLMDILTKLKKSYPKSYPSALAICGAFKIVQAIFVGVNSVMASVTLIPVLRWLITGDRTFIVPFPNYFTCDFIYPFVLIWSNYVGIYGIYLITSIMLMTSILITTISVEFYSLSDKIKNLKDMTEKEIELELPKLIKNHQKTFELVHDLKDIFSETFFFRFIVSASLIGLNLFQLQTTENVFENSIFLIYTCFEIGQVFLQCYFGQFLIDASEKIADEVYNCGWENWQRISLKKKLVNVLQRAQKPAVLTIWKFGVISMRQFTWIMDSAYNLTSLIMKLKYKF